MLTAEIKIISAGTRTFNNYELLKSKMDFYLSNCGNRTNIEIVSGGARGADSLGERYAKEKGFPVKEFFPDWSLGKKAGFLRNKEMSEYASHAVIFWDGVSRGSKLMIDLAQSNDLVVRVVRY